MLFKIGELEVKPTGSKPQQADDIGVYRGEELLKSFNSLSNDYAYTSAVEYARAHVQKLAKTPSTL